MSSLIKNFGDVLEITSMPIANLHEKRKPDGQLRRRAKHSRRDSVHDPREYEGAVHEGSRMVVTNGQDSIDQHFPQAEPSRPKIGILAEELAGIQEKIQAMQKRKEKQPAEPIVELQPNPEDLTSESESERGVSHEEIVEASSIVYTPISSPVQIARARVQPSKTNGAQEKPEGWDTFTPDQKWSVKPNLRARELLRSSGRAAILQELKEPSYVFRDAEVRDSLRQIRALMEQFARAFFAFNFSPADGVVPAAWYEELSPQTAKVIGCFASGGPGGVHGWHDLFIDEEKRRALVCAIIGNVLTEQVFKHMFFGARKGDVEAVSALQEKHRDEDGFDRNKYYAVAIRKILSKGGKSTDPLALPTNFNDHVLHIVGALWAHLSPILRLSQPKTSIEIVFDPLYTLVTQAGLLSLHMRLDSHTVYHFEPIFKEDLFTSQHMDCFNTHAMQQRNPLHPPSVLASLDAAEKERRALLSPAEIKRARNDNPLTQITILPSVCAYRIGGWETASSVSGAPVYKKPAYKSQGIRARVLTRGFVYCRWGRARRFKNGKLDDGTEKRHGDAWKGGFVEFTQVEGVPQWLDMERLGKREGVET